MTTFDDFMTFVLLVLAVAYLGWYVASQCRDDDDGPDGFA